MEPPSESPGVTPEGPTQILVFDGDCGFCTSTANWARGRLPSTVRVEAWQLMDDLDDLGLSEQEAARAAWWIDGSGILRQGHRAIAESLRAIGGGWALLGALMYKPPFSWLSAGIYRIVAANRHRLPGGTPACKVPKN